MPADVKLNYIIQRLFNPFEKANFNQSQLAMAENEDLDIEKDQIRPNPHESPSEARDLYQGAPLLPEF